MKQNFIIRKSNLQDLPTIMNMVEAARNFMIDNGNPTQWPIGSPSEKQIKEDIDKRQSYIVELNGASEATFCCQEGDDPTYSLIEEGEWPDQLPYVTIHRMASFGHVSGMGNLIFEWVQNHYPVIRCDTHRDNKKMQEILLNNGFRYCGIIYVHNGTRRLAYQWNKK